MTSTHEIEAAEAMALMRIDILEHEIDPSKAPRMEQIKFQCHEDPTIKIGFSSYIIDGALGTEEIIPHAMHNLQMLRQWPNLMHTQRAHAHMRTLVGAALSLAETAFNEYREGLANADTGHRPNQGEVVVDFEQFINQAILPQNWVRRQS